MQSVNLSEQFELLNPSNDVVFLDISFADIHQGRLPLELYGKTKLTENFRKLFTGEYKLGSTPQGYKNSIFHKLNKNGSLIHCGDYLNGDGTGNLSIYGRGFAPEANGILHDSPGLLTATIDNEGKVTCTFQITTKAMPELDG